MDWDDLVRSRRPQWTEKSPCESNNIETPIRHGELSKLTQETCSATSFRARLFGRDAQNQDKSEDLRSNGRCFPSAYRVHPYSRPVHLEPNRTQARRQRLHGLPTLNFTPVEPVPRTVTYLHRTQPSSVQCSHLPRHSALPWESVNSQWVPELETTSATETQPWDSRREAMVAPSEKLKPCRLDKSQEQLLERIKVAYAEKGQHLHSKVFDLLDDAYASLSEGLSAMVSEDRRTLARVRNLSADVDKPLSESYTYRRSDREPRDKQMVGTAAERVRREMTETAEFLEQSLKELDAAKAEEEEALSKVLMGPGDEERDKEFHRKMSELKQEAAALKRETLRKLAVVEEEFEEEKREILEELWLQS